MKELTVREQSRLDRLEAVIERTQRSLVEAGTALREIRDSRLYRETHRTFEAYCRERWGWTRQHANRTIAAAGVVGEMEPMGSIPTNERQARELAPLSDDPQQAREAWAEASNDSPATAARVKKAVQRRTAPPSAKGTVEVNCCLCSQPASITEAARHVHGGWTIPRHAGGANQIVRPVFDGLYAHKDCVRSLDKPITEDDLRRNSGIVVDLRDGGVLASLRRMEDAMRAVVMVRGKGVEGDALEEAVQVLGWIRDEAVRTLDVLRRESDAVQAGLRR
jgi:hypothetical protein